MPKHKEPSTLQFGALTTLCGQVQITCTLLETEEELLIQSGGDRTHYEQKSETFVGLIKQLPGPVLEEIVTTTVGKIIEKINTNKHFKGLVVALKYLLQPKLQKLDLGRLFFGVRLLRAVTKNCQIVLPVSLSKMHLLTCINICSKCTDEILIVLAKHCPDVYDLNISYSDLITDKGLKAICGKADDVEDTPGCKKIGVLGIHKCWEVTVGGIALLIQNLPTLSFLHYDQLGDVFGRKVIRDKKSTYQLTHFDQTYNVFTPSPSLMEYLSNICPHLQSVRVYISDRHIKHISCVKNLEILAVELDGPPGLGFTYLLQNKGTQLIKLNLSFEIMNYRDLQNIGEFCPALKELKMMGSDIEENENLVNTGNYFSNLEIMDISVWGESGITGPFISCFLGYCKKLKEVTLCAHASFLKNDYFQKLLSQNPLTNIEKVCLMGNPKIPLTIKTARLLIESCPNLEKLGISRWRISEPEYGRLQNEITARNLDILLF